jgi:hypothetical protein
MKQPGFFFIVFGAVYMVVQYFQGSGWARKTAAFRIGVFMIGGVLPLVITVGYLYASGVFNRFWFWTVEYGLKYGSQVPLSKVTHVFMSSFYGVVDGFFLLWIFSALGLVSLFLGLRTPENPSTSSLPEGGEGRGSLPRDKRLFVLLFAFFSFLTVCPGFYFRNHYFITLLPAVSLLVGIFFNSLYFAGARYVKASSSAPFKPLALKIGVVGVFMLGLMIGIWHQSEYFFKADPAALSRKYWGANPFPESIEIAKFIENNSSVDDKIAVMGSEPQIYFYSKRHSATGYIYTYSLMETHDYSLAMQQEMKAEIENSNPKFIVFVRVNTSWLASLKSEEFIINWLNRYLRENYNLVGVADIMPPHNTVYKWYKDISSYYPRSKANILVFQKKA